MSENINQNINCRLNIFEDFSFLENLNSDVIIAKNTYENLDFLENINQNIINSVDIYEELTLNELLNQISKISLNIYEASNFIEYINSSVTGYNLELNEAIFNGAIPSGNVLTINSDSYTAFLNLQNVIDKYSGEWIFISPETTEINIQPINNNMEIWIEYQELFL